MEIDYQTGNFGRNYALTRAIGDHFSIIIDEYRQIALNDVSFYQGHYYCPAAYGPSVMMLPAYLAAKIVVYYPLRLIASESFTQLFIAWLSLVFSMVISMAYSMVLIYRILIRQYHFPPHRYRLVIVIFMGSLFFPMSTIGFGESFSIIWIVGFLALLTQDPMSRGTLWGSALVLGIGIHVYYQLIFIVPPALYFIRKQKISDRLVWITILLISVFFLLLFNKINFTGWLDFPTHYWIERPIERQSTINYILSALSGISLSNLKFFQIILVDPRFGLVVDMPFLLLMIPAVFRYYKKYPDLLLFFLLVIGTLVMFYFLFNQDSLTSCGSSFGFRYFTPILVFFIIPILIYLGSARIQWWHVFILLISILICSLGAVIDPHIEPVWQNPIRDFLWPRLIHSGPRNIITWFLFQEIGLNNWGFNVISSLSPFLGIWWINRSDRMKYPGPAIDMNDS